MKLISKATPKIAYFLYKNFKKKCIFVELIVFFYIMISRGYILKIMKL